MFDDQLGRQLEPRRRRDARRLRRLEKRELVLHRVPRLVRDERVVRREHAVEPPLEEPVVGLEELLGEGRRPAVGCVAVPDAHDGGDGGDERVREEQKGDGDGAQAEHRERDAGARNRDVAQVLAQVLPERARAVVRLRPEPHGERELVDMQRRARTRLEPGADRTALHGRAQRAERAAAEGVHEASVVDRNCAERRRRAWSAALAHRGGGCLRDGENWPRARCGDRERADGGGDVSESTDFVANLARGLDSGSSTTGTALRPHAAVLPVHTLRGTLPEHYAALGLAKRSVLCRCERGPSSPSGSVVLSHRAAVARPAIPPTAPGITPIRSSPVPPTRRTVQNVPPLHRRPYAQRVLRVHAGRPGRLAPRELADRGGRDAAADARAGGAVACGRRRDELEYETFYEMFDPVKAAVWILPWCALLAKMGGVF